MIPAVKPDLIVISASTCAESWAWYMTGNHPVSYIGPSAVDGGQFFLCPLFIIFFLWESKAMKLIVECSSKIVCDKNGFSKFPTFLGTYTILRIPYYNPLFLLFSPWNVFFLPARVDMSTICYVSELSERSPQLWGTERSEKHRQAKLWTRSEDFLLPFILNTFPLLHSTSTYCKSPNVLKKKKEKNDEGSPVERRTNLRWKLNTFKPQT